MRPASAYTTKVTRIEYRIFGKEYMTAEDRSISKKYAKILMGKNHRGEKKEFFHISLMGRSEISPIQPKKIAATTRTNAVNNPNRRIQELPVPDTDSASIMNEDSMAVASIQIKV